MLHATQNRPDTQGVHRITVEVDLAGDSSILCSTPQRWHEYDKNFVARTEPLREMPAKVKKTYTGSMESISPHLGGAPNILLD